MASHRHDRLTEDIRRELTDIFRMLKDPRITGMISIVKVDLSGDQSYCKVYISSLDGLEAALSLIHICGQLRLCLCRTGGGFRVIQQNSRRNWEK